MPVYRLLKTHYIFPPPEEATISGLLAIGGDLSLKRLIKAYSQGIFPWFSEDEPILWYSPDPRFVLFPNNFRISSSLKQTINSNKFLLKIDTNLKKVIENCSSIKRKDTDNSTWITDEMKKAYINLHKNGYAHSFETYYNDELVGGLYGVSLGKAFFGESMFHTKSDASKFALFHLVNFAKKNDFLFIDAQIYTSHLESLGAVNIKRKNYLELLKNSLMFPSLIGKW